MLHLVLLVLYLAASYSAGQAKQSSGWDPNGLKAPPSTGDLTGNLDPDGLTALTPPTANIGHPLDPKG